MAGVDPQLVRRAPRSTEHLLELLFDGLDWPRPGDLDIEDIPLLPWTPDELHLDPQAVARLDRIQQLPKLTADQPFGVFILTFEGERLPVGAIRRVVNQLVRKQRARRQQAQALWDLEDLIFFCQAGTNHHALHVVAFRDTDRRPVMKVISWNTASTEDRIRLVGDTNLPALAWPEADTKAEQWREQWTAGFTAGYRQAIRSADTLATQMAEVATTVRDEVTALYEVETADGPLRVLYDELKTNLREDLTPAGFADMYAQTMVYGLLTARITNPDGFSADALDDALQFDNPLLDALYASFRNQASAAIDVDEFGLHDLAEALAQVDIDQVLADFGANNRKDDPVVFFYEEFLERYDPAQRRELGTYYTPGPVVRCIVRAIDDTLKALGLPDGVADQTTWADYQTRTGTPIPTGADPNAPVVRAIDPATGTGTFLIEWLRQATGNLDGRTDASIEHVVAQLDAFEISLSSYAVAHLKATLELPPEVRTRQPTNILLADTLAGRREQLTVLEDDPIAAEGQRAQVLKYDTPHTVVFGNPPYLRTDADGNSPSRVGGMIRYQEDGAAGLIRNFTEPLRQIGAGGHAKNIYNLYVYFWRWAIWKMRDQHDLPGVVAFITASSYLSGPGFAGMRKTLRETFDEMWIINLGGEGRGARRDDNVFPGVMTPVAIAIGLRKPTRAHSCQIHYRKIEGDRDHKLRTLEGLQLSDAGWEPVPADTFDSLVPAKGDHYLNWPALTDLLPWQHGGAKAGRTWVMAPDTETLNTRLKLLVSQADRNLRKDMFKDSPTGRKLGTPLGKSIMPGPYPETPIADMSPADRQPVIERFCYRSFDRSWIVADPRFLDRPGYGWLSMSSKQVFLTSLLTGKLGNGPGAVAAAHVPDLHHFSGRGGKDVIPLFRDANGTPNADPAMLAFYGEVLGLSGPVAVEDLFAYVYGVLAGTDYTARFADELETPGPRIPLTSDPALFADMVEHGRRLLWLHTYSERFGDGQPEHLDVPDRICWEQSVTVMPDTARDNRYDPDTQTLHVGDGALVGVREEVWDFEVSGMPVVKKWLGYRTRKGAGKSASSSSPLDQIRPDRWYDEWSDELRELVYVLDATIDAAPHGTHLLDRICAGPLVSADELPPVPDALRKVPKSRKASPGQMNLA